MALVDLEPDDVNSLAAPVGGELHARYEVHGCRFAGGPGRAESGRGVVIRQGERGHAARARPFHQLRRRQHAIGEMAVRMEIDEGFAACIHSGVRMIRAACHPHPLRDRIGRQSTPFAWTSTAHCSIRPTTTTSGATWCRNVSRLHSPWTCTPPMPRSRGALPSAAARWTGIASNTGHDRWAWTSVRCIAKCAPTWPGCRVRANSCSACEPPASACCC